jgi:hypothetical protein
MISVSSCSAKNCDVDVAVAAHRRSVTTPPAATGLNARRPALAQG